MLIGLISDTHIDSRITKLPSQIRDTFKNVDLILHAGDIWIPSVLDELESIAPVKAAWGDDDMKSDLGDDSRMMQGRSLILDNTTIWLTHILPPYGIINPQEESYSSVISQKEPEDTPDVIVFGHTHFATIEHYKDILLVNPGSVTLPNYSRRLGTVALLSLNSDKIEAHIMQL